MVNDNGSDESERLVDWPRRNVLKLAGVGVAGLGGAMAVGATGDDEKEGEKKGGDESDDEKGGDGGGDDHFLSDLVDPTFGYPLAADETDDVELRYVVEATLEEGPGPHPGFPTEDFGGPPADAEGVPTGMNGTSNGTEGTPTGPNEIPVEFFFDPVGLRVEPGSLVHFRDVLAMHTVSAYHEKFSGPDLEIPNRVPEGVPGFTSPPLTPEESWVYEFEEPGVYDYFCFPHLGLGMVGRIVVYDPEEHDLDDEAFAVPGPEGLLPNDELVLTAPELDPAHIVEHGEVAWSDLTLDGEGTGDDGTDDDETDDDGTDDDGTKTDGGTKTDDGTDDDGTHCGNATKTDDNATTH